MSIASILTDDPIIIRSTSVVPLEDEDHWSQFGEPMSLAGRVIQMGLDVEFQCRCGAILRERGIGKLYVEHCGVLCVFVAALTNRFEPICRLALMERAI